MLGLARAVRPRGRGRRAARRLARSSCAPPASSSRSAASCTPPGCTSARRSRVELPIRNLRGQRTPVLRLRDPVSGTRGADLLVPPLGARRAHGRRLPAPHRPARASCRSGRSRWWWATRSASSTSPPSRAPDGAADRATRTSTRSTPLPYTTRPRPAGRRPPAQLARAAPARTSTRCGPYVVGDDLRRIHWPSSARHDELLVRQNELPVAGPHHGAARRPRGRPPRRVARGGGVGGRQHRGGHRPAAATSSASSPPPAPTRTSRRAPTTSRRSWSTSRWCPPSPDGQPAPLGRAAQPPLHAAGRSWSSWPRCPPDDLRAAAHLRTRYGSVTIVHIDRSAWDPGAPVGPPPDVPALRVTRDAPFADRVERLRPHASTRRGRAARRSRADDRARPLVRGGRGRRSLAVTLAAVLGMSRLFDGGGWLGPLAVNAVAAHVVATGAAPTRLSLGAGRRCVMAVAAALVVTWTCYWSTTTLGIPTGDTLVGDARRPRRRRGRLYQDVVAPGPGRAPASSWPAALALWVIAYVADWAAFRLWVPFEATLPAGTLFLFTALLGADRGRGWAVAALRRRAPRLPAAAPPGPPGRHQPLGGRAPRRRPPLAADRRGRPGGGGGAGRARCSGPSLPGRRLPRRARPPRPRRRRRPAVTVSPLVDIRVPARRPGRRRGVHGAQPPSAPTGGSPRSSGSTGASGRRAAATARPTATSPRPSTTDVATETFEQTFTISALAAIWLPERLRAPGPRRARTSTSATTRTRPRSSSTTTSPTSDGLTYQVTLGARPASRPRTSTAPPARSRTTSATRFLELPDGFSPRVRAPGPRGHRRRRHALRAGPGPAGLPAHLHLRPRRCRRATASDALEHFLFDDQGGYCEQFAGAFAAMARRSASRPGGGGLHPGRGRPDRARAVPRARRARPRLARGVLRRRRLGGLRAHAGPGHARAPRPTPACPSSRPQPADPDGTVTAPTTDDRRRRSRGTARRPPPATAASRTPAPTPAATAATDERPTPRSSATSSIRPLRGRPGRRRARCSTPSLFPLGARCADRRRRRRRADAPLAAGRAGVGRGGGGRGAGRLPRAAPATPTPSGPHRLADALPERRARRRSPWPRACEAADYSADGRRPRRRRGRAGRGRRRSRRWPASRRRSAPASGAGSTRARSLRAWRRDARRPASAASRSPRDGRPRAASGSWSARGDRGLTGCATRRRRGGSARASGRGRRRWRRGGRWPSSSG